MKKEILKESRLELEIALRIWVELKKQNLSEKTISNLSGIKIKIEKAKHTKFAWSRLS